MLIYLEILKLLVKKIMNAEPKLGDYYVVYLWNYSVEHMINTLSELRDYQFKIFDDCPIFGGTKQRALIPFISKNSLIILRSTVYPGTTHMVQKYVSIPQAFRILWKHPLRERGRIFFLMKFFKISSYNLKNFE